MRENDIVINFDKEEVKTNEEVDGVIKINFSGRFDSIVINSQIENSSEIFNFVKLNDKKINYSYARMPILRQDLKNQNEIKFTVITKYVPQESSNVKFRATIIQEHKEVADDVAFLKIVS
ncbi:MAG TPA: hypothetical protein VE548_12690 [Nitrososphaeraceae archaeon]|jgi:hypothetical protein|nr:hypothetical protein [Nitrososphaeraceae archaeon]